MPINSFDAFPINASQLTGTDKWQDGDNWDIIPLVDSSGTAHIGLRLDFHNEDSKTIATDAYDWRITAGIDNAPLKFINDAGTEVFEFGNDGNLTMSGDTISINGGTTDIQLTANKTIDWTLASQGTIDATNLPAIAISEVFTVASEAAQIALTAQSGDVAIRTDLNKSYVHNGGSAGTIADWSELLTPTDAVLSVDGQTGAVSLSGTYAPLSHTHVIGDITNLQTTLDSKYDSSNFVAGTDYQTPLSNVAFTNVANTFVSDQLIQGTIRTPLTLERTSSQENINIEYKGPTNSYYAGFTTGGVFKVGDTDLLATGGDTVLTDANFVAGTDYQAPLSNVAFTNVDNNFTTTQTLPQTPTTSGLNVGSFNVQSVGNTNGFVGNNGYWDGTDWILKENGSSALLQFINDRISLRSTPSGTSGGSVSITTLMDLSITDGVKVYDNFTPDTDSSYDIGTSTLKFKDLYVDNIDNPILSAYRVAQTADPDEGSVLKYPAATTVSTGSSSNDIVIDLPVSGNNVFISLVLVIQDSYGPRTKVELGGYYRGATSDWINTFITSYESSVNNIISSVTFGLSATNTSHIILTSKSGTWQSYPRIYIEEVSMGWTGADDVVWNTPSNYSISLPTTNPTLSVFSITRPESAIVKSIYQNTGAAVLGVEDSVAGTLTVHGGNAGVGAKVRLHNGANDDTDIDFFDIEADAGYLDIRKDAINLLRLGGTLTTDAQILAGSQGANRALFYLYGGATTNGSQLRLYAGNTVPVGANYYYRNFISTSGDWIFDVQGGTSGHTGNLITVDASASGLINVNPPINLNSSVTIPNGSLTVGTADTTFGALRLESSSTSQGGLISLVNGPNQDTDVDVWRLEADAAGRFRVFVDGGTHSGASPFIINDDMTQIFMPGTSTAATTGVALSLGTDQERYGQINMYGNNGNQGPVLNMFNAANEDTDIDYFQIQPNGASLLFRAVGQESGNDTLVSMNWIGDSGSPEDILRVQTNIGVNGFYPGYLYLEGNDDTTSGRLYIRNGANSDTETDAWLIYSNTAGDFKINGQSGTANLGDVLTINRSTGHIIVEGGITDRNVSTSATSKTATPGETVYISASGQTVTLPANPISGTMVRVHVGNFTNTVVARNGQRIMSLLENMTIDIPDVTVTFEFIDSTRGWAAS
jgi:hypothetical protein